LFAAQLLLELSKQEDSRESIIADGCVPHVISRTNDVHCGEDAASILLELSVSPQAVGRIVEPDPFRAFNRSLRDTDTIPWQSTLCMALTNSFVYGASELETLPAGEVLRTCRGLVSTLTWNLTSPAAATATVLISKSNVPPSNIAARVGSNGDSSDSLLSAVVTGPNTSPGQCSEENCDGSGWVAHKTVHLLQEALPKGESVSCLFSRDSIAYICCIRRAQGQQQAAHW
jgi:hypothetical protein